MFFLSLITIIFIALINYYAIKFGLEPVDKYFREHNNFGIPILFSVVCLLIYLLFLLINYPSKKALRGCFLRFNEINQININWLKQNISSKEDFNNYGKENNSNP